MSKNLNKTIFEERIYELAKIIKDLRYHNKMNVSIILDYANENNKCLEI